MNELVHKTDAGRTEGAKPVAPVAHGVPQKSNGVPPVGITPAPALPSVPIGQPGYKFKFPVTAPQGQEERREHERLRKADKRAATRPAEPPPLLPPPLVDALSAPNGQQDPGAAAAPGAVGAEPFIPWVAADLNDFTDELVELTEAKRVSDFVTLAREADMPAKFIAEVEKRSHYPAHSKTALKRCLADCAAKWLNKSGVSSKNKEEVKLGFCLLTIKLQGVRLRKDLVALIEEDKAKRVATEKKTVSVPGDAGPVLAILK